MAVPSYRLLVVDDSKRDTLLLERILQQASDATFTVTHMESAKAGLEELSAQPYDLVLLDYYLPDMDGLAFLEEKQERGLTAPVIMLTAFGQERLPVAALQAGALDYFRKDQVNSSLLGKAIQQAIEKARLQASAAADARVCASWKRRSPDCNNSSKRSSSLNPLPSPSGRGGGEGPKIFEERVMHIGFHLTPFFSPAERSPTQIIDEVVQVVRAASGMGYAWVSAPHHWLAHPTAWPQPYPLLARLAPESGTMRLKTSVLLLPLLNPVEVAENIATLDHITHGRLDLGVALGYREEELQAVGLRRQDRVPKFEEALQVMKRLWAGEEVTFTGKYITLDRARLGFGPAQQPHPPIEFGAQSRGAVQRAARLADGIFLGPQVAWRDVRNLGPYKETRQEAGYPTVGMLGASRSLIVGARQGRCGDARPRLSRQDFRQLHTLAHAGTRHGASPTRF